MKDMQYIIEQSELANGLTFGTNPQPSTRLEFQQMIRDALKEFSVKEQNNFYRKAWDHLNHGRNLTIGDKIIYCKR